MSLIKVAWWKICILCFDSYQFFQCHRSKYSSCLRDLDIDVVCRYDPDWTHKVVHFLPMYRISVLKFVRKLFKWRYPHPVVSPHTPGDIPFRIPNKSSTFPTPGAKYFTIPWGTSARHSPGYFNWRGHSRPLAWFIQVYKRSGFLKNSWKSLKYELRSRKGLELWILMEGGL